MNASDKSRPSASTPALPRAIPTAIPWGTLSPRASSILRTLGPFLLEGYSEAETAARLGITKPQLDALLAEVRGELETEAGLRDELQEIASQPSQ